MYRGFEALFPRFLIVFIIINRRLSKIYKAPIKMQLQKASKAMHTKGTVAAVFLFFRACGLCERVANCQGRIFRGEIFEPLKSCSSRPLTVWPHGSLQCPHKSENAERRLVALTQYPFRVLRHSLRDGARVSSAKASARAVFCCLCYKVVFF